MKLSELAHRISRYYSTLTSLKNQSVKSFQEFVFLSLLEERSERQIFTITREVDLDEQRANLIEAYEQLGIDKNKFIQKFKKFSAKIEAIRTKESRVGKECVST